jgi:hypothetical protein
MLFLSCIVHDHIGRAYSIIRVTHELIIIQRSSIHNLREDLDKLRASTEGETGYIQSHSQLEARLVTCCLASSCNLCQRPLCSAISPSTSMDSRSWNSRSISMTSTKCRCRDRICHAMRVKIPRLISERVTYRPQPVFFPKRFRL